MISIFTVILFKFAINSGFAGAHKHAAEVIEYFQGEGFACFKAGILYPAEVILRIRAFRRKG
jgi:hypothetical protein